MTQYRSKPVSQDGRVEWSHEEDAIWSDLVTRQMSVIKERACDAYLRGLELLNLPQDRASVAGNQSSLNGNNRMAG